MTSLRKLRGILTEDDKQKFLAKLLDEHTKSKKQKLIETFFSQTLIETCPYCKKDHEFPPPGQGDSMRKKLKFKYKNQVIDKDFFVAKCPVTNRYIFFSVDVIIEGDILTGETHSYSVQSFTDEEIRQAIDWKMTELDDELAKALGIRKTKLKFF